MDYDPLLGPVIALVAWTLVMLLWMIIVGGRAIKTLPADYTPAQGMRGVDLEGVVEPRYRWPAHNYMHLMEQPTIFYAICFATILLGGGQVWINQALAWGYVGLRVAHSLVQATTNVLMARFAVFALSSLCLIGLTVHAAARFIHGVS